MAQYKWPNGIKTNYRPAWASRSHGMEAWRAQFRELELDYLAHFPHLARHVHGGLCADSESRPTRRVKLPNGLVIWSTWYKVPTTDADHRRAHKEQIWLTSGY